MIVYLTHWFRHEDRAKAVAVFMTAIPLANIFGSPLAGQILKIHWYGFQGWRWLFILEGVPAVVFGIVTLFYLTDWPKQAAWLPKEECDWITGELERERLRKKALCSYTIWQALTNRDVLLLTLVYFMGSTAIYGLIIWFPTILKRASGLSTTTVTLLVMIPYLAGLIAMMLNGWHSDRTNERRWHTSGALVLSGCSLMFALFVGPHFWIQIVLLFFSLAFIHAYQPTFWALPTSLLGESAAAACIGLINCIGGLGGFVGPYIMGYLVTRTGSFKSGLVIAGKSFSGWNSGLFVRRNQIPHEIVSCRLAFSRDSNPRRRRLLDIGNPRRFNASGMDGKCSPSPSRPYGRRSCSPKGFSIGSVRAGCGIVIDYRISPAAVWNFLLSFSMTKARPKTSGTSTAN